MLGFLDELEAANNAYRTKDHIVTQELVFQKNKYYGSSIKSHDVYYERTKERDAIYDKVFELRLNLEGKRITAQTFTRCYVK